MKGIRELFQKLSMRYKLFLPFAIPLTLIFSALTFTGYRLLEKNYGKQILYSAEQAYGQALNFLENYVQNMSYMLERMDADPVLRSAMESGEFRRRKDYGDQWRDFLELNNAFLALELSNRIYRCSMYVPDTLFYSGNREHFFPESELNRMMEYERFAQKIEGGTCFLTRLDEEDGARIVMLRPVCSRDSMRNILGIVRVDLDAGLMREVLAKSDVIRKGISFLVDESGNIVLASDEKAAEQMRVEVEFRETPFGWEEAYINGIGKVLVRSQTIAQSSFSLYSVVPREEFYSQSRLVAIAIFFFAVVMILFIFAISWLLAGYYTRRIRALSQKMRQIQEGNVNLEVDQEEGDEIGQLFEAFRYMTKEIRGLMLEQYRLGRDVKHAELKALQAQINPHFLYNTLDLIYWSAMDYQAEEIMEIARNLAKFYRVSLNKGKQAVSVEEELSQIKAYIGIEKYHFDGAISFSMEVGEEVMRYGCINLILQPFVENAINYSLAKIPDRESCNICLRAKLVDGDILFSIEDDGVGMDKEEIAGIFADSMRGPGKGYGVKNVNFRIKLCYGERYGVSYESKKGQGTIAYIRIPAMTEEELEKQIR